MIGVDVGGTFTDLVSIENGKIRTVKVQTDVDEPQQGVLRGAEEIGVDNASVFNHASTHGLNAVITRQLPKVAFLTTMGHIDMLDAGRAWRPVEGLLDATWRRSFGDAGRPLVPRHLRRGIRERITADGATLIGFDEDQARAQVSQLRDLQVEGIAICLLNSYVDGGHEQRLRDIVREILGDDTAISISSEVSPLAKEYARASTTVVDVLMKLIYVEYTDKLVAGLGELGFSGEFNFADGAAQLIPAEIAIKQPFKIVFSGPAAGTVSSAYFGQSIGESDLLCADIGGTSCDISVVSNGRPYIDTTIELEHDLVVNTLSNEVSAIGAGGGSLITINSVGDLLVGPGSAGAKPGPACYGLDGTQPTMTDICLLMGIIDPSNFAGGKLTLQPELARAAVEGLDSKLSFDQRVRYAFNTGINNIAEGLTNISVRHGIDPRDYSLMAYGAAGPMLLPATLDLIRTKEVVIPPHPGLFSALGLLSSDLVFSDSRSAYIVLDPSRADDIEAVYRRLEENVFANLSDEQKKTAEFSRSFDAKLIGQSWETPFIAVPSGPLDAAGVNTMIDNFHGAYQERSGNRFEAIAVQAATFRVQAVVSMPKVEHDAVPDSNGRPAVPSKTITISYLESDPIEAGEYDRADLQSGQRIIGPAVVRETMSTTLIVPGQEAIVGQYGELRIRKSA